MPGTYETLSINDVNNEYVGTADFEVGKIGHTYFSTNNAATFGKQLIIDLPTFGTNVVFDQNYLNKYDPAPPVPPPPPPPPPVDKIEYDNKGLTYKSNLTAVMNRDAKGNVKLNEGATDNQLLILESAISNFSNKSVIDTINTQFKHYKFPAQTTDSGDDLVDVNLGTDIENPGLDVISGHYVLDYLTNAEGDPANLRRMSISTPNTWYTNGASTTSGRKKVRFNRALAGPQQSTPGEYTLTPDMIEVIKSTNSAIKFHIHVAIQTHLPWDTSNCGVRVQLARHMPGHWRQRTSAPVSNTDPRVAYAKSPSGIDQFNTRFPPQVYRTSGVAGSNWFDIDLVYILSPDDMKDYDSYEIQAYAGGEAWMRADTTYWDISVIPDPGWDETWNSTIAPIGGYGQQPQTTIKPGDKAAYVTDHFQPSDPDDEYGPQPGDSMYIPGKTLKNQVGKTEDESMWII